MCMCNLSIYVTICSIVCIRDELVVTSKDGYLWRVQWDGKFNEDYTLNLCNISFFLDQLQSRGNYMLLFNLTLFQYLKIQFCN